jgi:hypothetical protein
VESSSSGGKFTITGSPDSLSRAADKLIRPRTDFMAVEHMHDPQSLDRL